LLLEAIRRQTYQLNEIEVIIADGMSDDGTRDAIQDYASQHPELSIRLIDNPQRIIPAALNVALKAAKGNVIIRLDAHSAPKPDYVERCLAVLEETDAANVGGVWEIQPGAETWIARAIAAAASHPLGAGDARYRISGHPGPVDTVPFGAFRKDWLERVGPFNEDLLTNEDYEYNARIRKAGGVVALWVLEGAHAPVISRYTPLAAGASSDFCVDRCRIGVPIFSFSARQVIFFYTTWSLFHNDINIRVSRRI